MPAAAVIPAPIAYIKVVAVKKLVVELWTRWVGPPNGVHWPWRVRFFGWPVCSLLGGSGVAKTFTLKKLECSKQARA